MILVFVVLAIIVVIEKLFFVPGTGLGISEPIVFPKLIEPGVN